MIRPATSSTTISTLSLHDALPIYKIQRRRLALGAPRSNGSHVRQHRTDLALDDAGRHSVSAAVCRHTGWYVAVRAWREVDDRKAAARLERRRETCHDRSGLGEVMVGITNQNGVAA